SDLHPWFQQSRSNRQNDKQDWYVWANPRPDGTPPNNWLSVFYGPSWTWDARRGQYYMHNFLPSQPNLNVNNPAVQEALYGRIVDRKSTRLNPVTYASRMPSSA